MNKITHEFGVLYAATGDSWIDEAVEAARSARACMPDVPIAIVCNAPDRLPDGLFSSVSLIREPTWSTADKISAMRATPFAKTLYLDTDTRVVEPVVELAALLDRFDLAYCHAPYRYLRSDSPGVNAAFPMGNTGVIVFRRSAAVLGTLETWDSRVKLALEQPPADGVSDTHMVEQAIFRAVIFGSDLNCTILPPEYNLRTIFPYFVGGRSPAKILHGRGPSLAKAMGTVNMGTGRPRIGDASRSGREVIGDALRAVAREISCHLDWDPGVSPGEE